MLKINTAVYTDLHDRYNIILEYNHCTILVCASPTIIHNNNGVHLAEDTINGLLLSRKTVTSKR